jgi:biotin-dependent carboxylase-like uncharacterized protein
MPTIRVLRPGSLTLVQDLGRPGSGASGVPRGGAFDPWAARAANRLVGNPDDAALLEVTLAGPLLELDGVAAIALAGDPFDLEVEGGSEPARSCAGTGGLEAIPLRGAARISIGRALSGVRAWLAVAGGIDVPLVLGSRSTDLSGAFGGFEGRALRAGDLLSLFPGKEEAAPARPRARRPRGDHAPIRLRVVPGPEERLLAGGGLAVLEQQGLTVSPHSDRRGIRLTGSNLALAPHAPLRSQGTLPGAVQIPPAGEPIVLGVDAPVTGGYPWVAQVIEADLGRLAHLAPGAPVSFELVDFAAAERAFAERRRHFEMELAAE